MTPVATGPSATNSLFSDWRESTVQRLKLIAAMGFGLGIAAQGLTFLRQANLGARAGYDRPLWLVPAFIFSSLVMLLVARSEKLTPSKKLDASLGYLVVSCTLVSLFRHSLPYTDEDVLRGFSPIVAGLAFFSIAVPLVPKKLLWGASIAALSDPLALLGYVWLADYPLPTRNLCIWLFSPTLASVILTGVVARLLFDLGTRLKQAERMGQYRLIRPLGEGGMGEVWLAEHDTLARTAAIKLVRPSVLNEAGHAEALARFEREAQATAMLTSPHTLELYDYGVTSEGQFFHVMEFLDGCTLEQVSQGSAPLPCERAVYLLGQICHSLRDAHAHGVVHRDIKPANILVCKKGGEFDFVKVLDFGLARRLNSKDERLTQENAVSGTPAFMAPEQAQGGLVDRRADVYAIGCLGYRLLSGRDVFTANSALQIMMKHAGETPDALGSLVPSGVPTALVELIMKCLAKVPEERPQDAGEVLALLERIPMDAKWTQSRAQAWWKQFDASAEAASLETAKTEAALNLGNANTEAALDAGTAKTEAALDLGSANTEAAQDVGAAWTKAGADIGTADTQFEQTQLASPPVGQTRGD